MREDSPVKTILAALVALALAAAPYGRAAAQEAAPKADRLLEGRILSDEGKPIEKAVVKIRNLDTGDEFTSPPTAANGNYKFTRLPPGRYEVAVQTERGMYLGNRTVDLVNKEAQSYSFSLKAASPEQALKEAEAARGEEEPRRRPTAARPAITPSEAASKMGLWNNPTTAVLLGIAIAIGAAIVIDEARDDDDEDASPSAP